MLNKSALQGRFTADPQIKDVGEYKVCNFTLAVSRNRDRQKSDFIDAAAWGKSAEYIVKYFKKGQQAVISGQIRTDTWEDTEGHKRKSTYILVEEIHFAGDKRKEEPMQEISEEEDGNLPF